MTKGAVHVDPYTMSEKTARESRPYIYVKNDRNISAQIWNVVTRKAIYH